MPNPYDRELSISVLLEHIQDINAATSTTKLIDIWKASFHEFGFDSLAYTSFSGFDAHETKPSKKTYISNIPDDVVTNYYKNQAIPIDPVLKFTFSTMEPLWLSDAATMPFFQRKEYSLFMRQMFEFVDDAFCIPIIGPNFIKGYIYAAYDKTSNPDDRQFKKGDIINWHLVGLSSLFHTRYCKLRMSNQFKVELTKREMDVLQCVVAGKTNRVIGHDLGISTNTVNSYLKNIFLSLIHI